MTDPLNSSISDAGRSYLWPPTGETFPSVTTVIAGGTPTPLQLMRWIARTNARYAVERAHEWLPIAEVDPHGVIDHLAGAAERSSGKAATRGSEVHAWADAIAGGTAQGCPPPEIAGYVEAFLEFTDDWHPEYVYTEATTYNRTLGYAGTFDWMARFDGKVYLGDIKTKLDGKSLYGTAIRLQLAAYRYAEFIGIDNTEVPMPKVEGAVALVLYPNRYDLIPVEADEEAFEVFCAAMKVRRFCLETGAKLDERLVAK